MVKYVLSLGIIQGEKIRVECFSWLIKYLKWFTFWHLFNFMCVQENASVDRGFKLLKWTIYFILETFFYKSTLMCLIFILLMVWVLLNSDLSFIIIVVIIAWVTPNFNCVNEMSVTCYSFLLKSIDILNVLVSWVTHNACNSLFVLKVTVTKTKALLVCNNKVKTIK